jgi:hypothetical protein
MAIVDNIKEIAVSEVVFREDLYPRLETSALTVQKYAEDLDVLPPIEVNQHNEIIDGWHRWTAHRKNGAEMIRAIVTETECDTQLLEFAITRNATHGLQLSQQDKRDIARKIYAGTPLSEQGKKKQSLARILSVSESLIYTWLAHIDKDNKEKREAEIVQMYLSCHTQEQIAEAVGMTSQGVGKVLKQIPNLEFVSNLGDFSNIADDAARQEAITQRNKEYAYHTAEFTLPLYNIWRQQEKSEASVHFGNTEPRWLDNLLYLYTDPFDIVVDPFAGGGSTIDICKKRFRRYFVSDRKPIVEREKEIRKHDITEGLPKLPAWKPVKLVYLDPPYWKQAEGQYSNDATDLANMPIEEFNKTLAGLIKAFADRIKASHTDDPCNAYIALVMQPTQWRAPGRQVVDHVADMLNAVDLPLDMRYSAPYSTQQYTAQMVEWAKENKRCLVLTREIIVWRVEQ